MYLVSLVHLSIHLAGWPTCLAKILWRPLWKACWENLSHTSLLMRMKFDMVLEQFKPNNLILHQSEFWLSRKFTAALLIVWKKHTKTWLLSLILRFVNQFFSCHCLRAPSFYHAWRGTTNQTGLLWLSCLCRTLGDFVTEIPLMLVFIQMLIT